MSKQPEALRLAELWEKHSHGYARTPEAMTAAELRRLHAECQHHKAWVAHITAENKSLEAQRDALLDALKELMEYAGIIEERCDTVATNKARAAIKAVEEGK